LKRQFIIEEYIHINEEYKKAGMGDKFSRIEYETDQIKEKFRFKFKTEFSICFKFCNSFRFIYLYHKARKLKTGCFYTNNNKSQRGYL
jgi:hypothetical protein